MTTKTCKHCGAQFLAVPPNRKYCSRSCATFLRRSKNAEKCRERYWRDPLKHNAATKAHYAKNRNQIRTEMKRRWNQTRAASPWKHLMDSAKHRAKVAILPFDLTNEWAAARWTGRCELSGVEFHLMLRTEDTRMFAASIDRIEPAKGYTRDNCRFILFAVNAMRQNGTDADVLRIASGLVSNMFIPV